MRSGIAQKTRRVNTYFRQLVGVNEVYTTFSVKCSMLDIKKCDENVNFVRTQHLLYHLTTISGVLFRAFSQLDTVRDVRHFQLHIHRRQTTLHLENIKSGLLSDIIGIPSRGHVIHCESCPKNVPEFVFLSKRP